MTERYIGIENELKSFRNGVQVSFEGYFLNLRQPSDYRKSPSSVRTSEGLGFYVDGQELEILTPPVVLNKGFATRLTECLVIGRDKVVESTPELQHTGYSMHWNLTKQVFDNEDFFAGIAVPFHLFGLTPLSVGANVRCKEDGPLVSRYELLGDSLQNEEQIKAMALMLGAYTFALEDKGELPFRPLFREGWRSEIGRKLWLPDGRYSSLEVYQDPIDPATNQIQAQQYLELFYQWMEPFVHALGTPEEVQNLEAFINGDKKLEFDRFKFYAHLKDLDGSHYGTYWPTKRIDEKENRTLIKHSGSKRELPLEARLLGSIVENLREKRLTLDWGRIVYSSVELGGWVERHGTVNIYRLANSLDPKLPEYQGTLDLSNVHVNSIPKTVSTEKFIYDPSEDSYHFPEDTSKIKMRDLVVKELRKTHWWEDIKKLFWATLVAAGMGVCAAQVADCGIQDSSVEQAINHYKYAEAGAEK